MDNYFILQYVSCISHDGYLSNFFNQEEGLRQGCNLSPLLFIIAAEIIASKIRQSNEIRGIELPSIDHDKKKQRERNLLMIPQSLYEMNYHYVM